ncbi:hypothetical protein E1211_21265 [Micromonospora sp. 15K316]|uniref:DUF6401 family natural product biosynthesis protein n=1 Tax=Micromonospora sp. 15K316 TaxID=2530376 RepID=UPI001051412C|nr:DUF6401 family natural product biosynthesis protein [Micromonospora sp. 15K316]TDC32223.1 hypothetical protein E1211_21265 [Micromonospora sp. 15K316]
MRVPFNRVAPHAVDSARSALAVLAGAVGDGLTAIADRPGLHALVDQHAAAVRDSLGGDLHPLTVAVLAGYLEGLLTAASERGWRPVAGPVDWSDPDWLRIRLLAVHYLARTLAPA